ncbi:hypothetical protein BKA62DRAFT_708767 [Auriculariales sp. MPI-PUGE-AT-0066]|nr:hypothetical protein BKA62DRAFT_708767 [Auriculariales sp. MPI-PUGE-AT-0066]
MEKLPIEIVTEIFRVTAYLFRLTDRGTVVRLALTSSFVYDAVSPILYERIVIGSDQEESGFLTLLKNEPVAAKVLKHVTFLCTGAARSTRISPSAATLFINIKAVYGSMALWSAIAKSANTERGGAIARDLRVWTAGLADLDLTGIHQPNLCCLTRLHTFIPHCSLQRTFHKFSRDPTGWTRQMLALLPSLTHLGFSHVDPDFPKEGAESKNLDACLQILRVVATSQTPSIHVVALRITGRAAICLNAYIRIAQAVDEGWAMSCMYMWVDQREIKGWLDESALMIDDARKERSIWTEAKPLSWYNNAPGVAAQ